MAKGDHIYVNYPGFSHHGIDCGDGNVIHYGKKESERFDIDRVPKDSFADGKKIYVKNYGTCDPADVIVRRAESKLGEQAYNLFGNNCEHFAYWCKTEKYKSEQVKNAGAAVAGGVAAGTIGMGTKVATKIATEAATKTATEAAKQALNPVSKFLINVGVKEAPVVTGKVVGGTAAGIAGVGGIVSGLATDMVVGTMLKDDEHLPPQERKARETGRTAGQVASTVGGIGGTIAAATVGGGAAVAAAVVAPAVLGIGIGLAAYHLMKGN